MIHYSMEFDVAQQYSHYTGIRPDIYVTIGFHLDEIFFMDIRGLLRAKVRSCSRWDASTGEVDVYYSPYDADKLFQSATSGTNPDNKRKQALKMVARAVGEVNLGGGEITQGLKTVAPNGDFPFVIERAPLTRGIMVKTANGSPSSLEDVVRFLMK